MKCIECGTFVKWYNALGPIFNSKKKYCSKKCLYQGMGWNFEDDMGLDEYNQVQIKKLTQRIDKLEKKSANQVKPEGDKDE